MISRSCKETGSEHPDRSHRHTITLLVIAGLILFSAASVKSATTRHFYCPAFSRQTNITVTSVYSQLLNRDVPYSVYLPPGYFDEPLREYPVVYYFHGFDRYGNAHTDWLTWHMDEALDEMIASGQVQEMIIVMPGCFATGIIIDQERGQAVNAVSLMTFPFRLLRGIGRTIRDPTYFGSYLFVQRWDLSRSDYRHFIIEEFLPYIENTYRIRWGKENRAVCGFSTGGYSALSIAFQHPHLFDSASAHAPMVLAGSPFSDNADTLVVDFDPATGQNIPHRFAINLFTRIFEDETTWQANSPLWLARTMNLENLPVYVDVAEGDKRRYDKGVVELVEILRRRGVPVVFESLKGLDPAYSHTYPGFINGTLVAKHARGKSEKELRRQYGWKNVRLMINPEMQQIKHSLLFHSGEFARQE